jgi:hypothetical protein
MQPANPAANTAANSVANPATNVAANPSSNAAGNVANNATNAAGAREMSLQTQGKTQELNLHRHKLTMLKAVSVDV